MCLRRPSFMENFCGPGIFLRHSKDLSSRGKLGDESSTVNQHWDCTEWESLLRYQSHRSVRILVTEPTHVSSVHRLLCKVCRTWQLRVYKANVTSCYNMDLSGPTIILRPGPATTAESTPTRTGFKAHIAIEKDEREDDEPLGWSKSKQSNRVSRIASG